MRVPATQQNEATSTQALYVMTLPARATLQSDLPSRPRRVHPPLWLLFVQLLWLVARRSRVVSAPGRDVASQRWPVATEGRSTYNFTLQVVNFEH